MTVTVSVSDFQGSPPWPVGLEREGSNSGDHIRQVEGQRVTAIDRRRRAGGGRQPDGQCPPGEERGGGRSHHAYPT